jgi:hypothetical protein
VNERELGTVRTGDLGKVQCTGIRWSRVAFLISFLTCNIDRVMEYMTLELREEEEKEADA